MKKLLALLLTAALVVTVFAGCGKNSSAESNNSSAAKKKITMGTNATFPPFESVDDSGKIVGLDADIAAAIAEKLNMELVIKDMEFDSLIPAVKGGSIDFAMAGITVNDERKESVNFTDTYAKGVQVVIVKEGSAIKTVDDLKGKKIGVQTGTTGDSKCTGDYGQENVKQYANGPLAVAALQKGQIDCVVIDQQPAKAYVASASGLKILDTAYADENYAIAVSKDNTELLNNMNKALSELKAAGKIDEIVGKYIKE